MAQANLQNLRYNIFASIIGNTLEWFDFALFGCLAPLFATLFLQENPGKDPVISLFFLYFIGLLARPIGGILFSFFGDTLGRRFVLMLSIGFMTASAVFTAFLPTREFAGIFASILLLFAMSLHNISAGGENPAVICYIIESSPKYLRVFSVSWAYFGVLLGIFLGTVDFASLFWELKPGSFSLWGWRLPFIISAVLGACGFFLRRKLHETPSFEKSKSHHELAKNPLVITLRDHKIGLVKGLLVSILDPIIMHSLVIFTPTYLQLFLKKEPSISLILNIYSLLLCLMIIPFAGLVAQQVGRNRFLKINALLLFLFAYPLYSLIATGITSNILIAQGLLCLLCSSFVGALPSAVCLLFPTPVRCTGYALSHNIPVAIFGGIAPLFLAWGIQSTGLLTFPSFYLMFGALVSFITLFYIKEDT